jgi:hypothetical protein
MSNSTSTERGLISKIFLSRWTFISATMAMYMYYKGSSLSADGTISAAVACTLGWITVFNIVCDYAPEPDSTQSKLTNWICEFCHRENRSLSSLMKRIYELRWVFLLILAALFVSAIAPVSAFLEIQENITSASCRRLASENFLNGIDVKRCVEVSDVSQSLSVGAATGGLKNHFIQIAMWPLILALYGMIYSFLVWLPQKTKGLTLEQAVERVSHGSHLLKVLLALMFVAGSLTQDALGL